MVMIGTACFQLLTKGPQPLAFISYGALFVRMVLNTAGF